AVNNTCYSLFTEPSRKGTRGSREYPAEEVPPVIQPAVETLRAHSQAEKLCSKLRHDRNPSRTRSNRPHLLGQSVCRSSNSVSERPLIGHGAAAPLAPVRGAWYPSGGCLWCGRRPSSSGPSTFSDSRGRSHDAPFSSPVARHTDPSVCTGSIARAVWVRRARGGKAPQGRRTADRRSCSVEVLPGPYPHRGQPGPPRRAGAAARPPLLPGPREGDAAADDGRW